MDVCFSDVRLTRKKLFTGQLLIEIPGEEAKAAPFLLTRYDALVNPLLSNLLTNHDGPEESGLGRELTPDSPATDCVKD